MPEYIFKSCAQWPKGTFDSQNNYTEDAHHSYEAAQGVCNRLRREGAGGEGKSFPIRVWVDDPRPDSEKSERELREEMFDLGRSAVHFRPASVDTALKTLASRIGVIGAPVQACAFDLLDELAPPKPMCMMNVYSAADAKMAVLSMSMEAMNRVSALAAWRPDTTRYGRKHTKMMTALFRAQKRGDRRRESYWNRQLDKLERRGA